MSAAPDHYRTLQVDPEADPEVVTAAYRALARRLHPDRDITGVAEYRMAELNRAYAVLRDPQKRRSYDEDRALRLKALRPGEQERPRRGGLSARINPDAGASGQENGGPQETRLTFGRYAGMTLREIAQQDAEYLRWLARHSSGLRYRQEIERLLKESLETAHSPHSSR